MLRWINGTWETVATIPIADYLNTERWFLVSEGRGGFKVNWVPSKLDKRFAGFDRVPTKYVRAPVAMRLVR